MSMITKGKAGPLPTSCLLFSGGMDSVCFAHLLKPDLLLYVPSEAIYTQQEKVAINNLGRAGAINMRGLYWAQNILNLHQFERDDLIVPNRNAHLVLLASNYADTIWLASVEGDRSSDKDRGFYRAMEILLDHMWQESHWTAARHFSVGSPFKDATKRELVDLYLKQGGNPEHMLVSYSCYRGQERHCGVCKPCARKRVALELNDIRGDIGYWEQDFWKSDWWPTLWPQMLDGKYRGREDSDFVAFMQRGWTN